MSRRFIKIRPERETALCWIFISSRQDANRQEGRLNYTEGMYRRRGSAPAVVLQQTLQQFQLQESREFALKFDSDGKHSLYADTLKQNMKLKKGRKEKDFEKRGNGSPSQVRYNDRTFSVSDSESCPTLPGRPETPPSSQKKLDRSAKIRYKRRGSEPVTIAREFCTPFYPTAPSKNYASLYKKCGSLKDYHLVLLGQGGVGKSALLVRFATGRFIHEYDPTLEMTYDVCVEVDEDAATLHITDTASTHEPVYLNQNEGFVVVYAVDDFRTFETAKQLVKLIREIKKQKGQHCSIALVGNKMDLRHNRVVSRKRARGFAVEHECLFYEASAASDINVKVIFHETIRQLRLLQLTKKANQGPMNSIKKMFHKIKTDD